MNNNDLISRAALLESLEQHYDLMYRLYVDIHVLGMQSGFKSAIDKVKEFPAVDAAPQWISVQDRLPDMCGMPCLLYGINQYGQGRVFEGFTGYMRTGQLTWHAISAENDIAALNVSHWMPLPEPPEDENS